MNDQKMQGNEKKKGQGFNDSRGEIADEENTPKNNGQNVDNDPAHQAERKNNKQRSNRKS